GAIAILMRPRFVAPTLVHGPLIRVQFVPPLVERYTPFVAAPKISPSAAYWWSKLPESISTSVASPNKLWTQFDPPSWETKMPRDGAVGGMFVPAATSPMTPREVATTRIFGLEECTLISLNAVSANSAFGSRNQLVPP